MNLKILFIAMDIKSYENQNIYKDHIFNFIVTFHIPLKVGKYYKEMTQYSNIIYGNIVLENDAIHAVYETNGRIICITIL